jgi:hypothetical protein
MALTGEEIKVVEAPSPAPPERPSTPKRAIIGWAAVGVAVAAAAALAVAVFADDDDSTSARTWTGDVKDHPGYGPGDPAQAPWTGDAKDHPNYGQITVIVEPRGDAKDHAGYGPIAS